MKRIGTILILFVTTFLFMPKVFATNYMSVTDTDIKVGESFDIKVNFDYIAAWDLEVTAEGAVGECRINEADATADAKNTAKEFKTTCSATKVGTITLNLTGNVTKAAEGDETENPTIEFNETIQLNVTAQEEPKGLSTLQVTGGTLSPIFDSSNIENTGYTITLDSYETTSFKITATAKTGTDKIEATRENGSGYESINIDDITFITSGDNNTMLIEINVGENNRLVKYRITVVRPSKPNIGAPELLTLTVGGENIPLVSGLYKYSIELDEENLNENGAYIVNATLKDDTNYKFSEFLVPPEIVSGKEFTLKIIPKDPSSNLDQAVYTVNVKTNIVEPVTIKQETTTKKNNGNVENPQTGSMPALIVGIILITSLVASLYLYKKNINGYN